MGIKFENYGNEIIPKDDLTWGKKKPIIRYLDSFDKVSKAIQTLAEELRESKIRSLQAIDNGITYEEYYLEYVETANLLLSTIGDLASKKIVEEKLDKNYIL